MGWFSRKVLVTFIDHETDTVIGRAEMPPDDLPESFEVETTLHLGGEDWSVIHAEPRTRPAYTKAGSLTLRLRKLESIAPEVVSFSQLDITEQFGDDKVLGNEEWISTTPLNASVPNPEASGLPAFDADSDEVYRIGSELSKLRESIPIPGDGVYCPICHIANVDLDKLRKPCPQCGRDLLKFGWD